MTALATIGFGTLATPAGAATLEKAGATITYRAEPDERNQLTISVLCSPDCSADPKYVFTDPGAFIAGGSSCPNGVCSASGVGEIVIVLRDQDDHLEIVDRDGRASPPGPLGVLRTIVANGQEGNDTLTGGAGPEQLIGGTGNDVLQGGGGNDSLDFGAPDDTLGRDALDGGPGDDQLNGGPAGDDEPDTLAGGDGTDTADYSDRTSSVRIDLDGGNDDGEAGEHDNVQPDVEHVIGGSGRDALIGSDADNFLEGRGGEDQLDGRGGGDVLDGGANDPGGDNLAGGDGNDQLYGRAGDDELDGGLGDDVLAGAGGNDTLDADAGNDTALGGAGQDTLDGGAGDDTLNGAEPNLAGADGDDKLNGGAGQDSMLGDAGDDALDGGPGPDDMHGGSGEDTVKYQSRGGPVTVTLNNLPDDGENGEGDNVASDIENIVGGALDDTLWGDGDDNVLQSGPGEDLLTGNAGTDDLESGNAPDLIDARDGQRDVVDCGEDGDLAIVDKRDAVRNNCETIDAGGKRRLVVGRSGLVRPTSSGFGLRLPDGNRFFPLKETVKIPLRSTIDPGAGGVRLGVAKNDARGRQWIWARGGRFSVRQKTGRPLVTELRLSGPAPGPCTTSAASRAAAPDQAPRRLLARIENGKKRKKNKKNEQAEGRVRGKYSDGAAKGTEWLTEDRCDGTLTTVMSGTVRVRNLVRNRTVIVRAGHRYLARPR